MRMLGSIICELLTPKEIGIGIPAPKGTGISGGRRINCRSNYYFIVCIVKIK